MARYHVTKPGPGTSAVIADTLESIAREGARRLLADAMRAEVDIYLERPRHAEGGRRTGYRNGYAREREVGIGSWSVEVRPPRISDIPDGTEPFATAILPRRRYLSTETQRLFARLYLASPRVTSSPPSASCWARRPRSRVHHHPPEDGLGGRVRDLEASSRRRSYGYIWADGIYLGAGLKPAQSCLLVVTGRARRHQGAAGHGAPLS